MIIDYPRPSTINQFLHDYRKNDKRKIQRNPNSKAAFNKIKTKVANIASLAHPFPNAQTRIVSDASDTGIGAVLEQCVNRSWKLLALFPKR